MQRAAPVAPYPIGAGSGSGPGMGRIESTGTELDDIVFATYRAVAKWSLVIAAGVALFPSLATGSSAEAQTDTGSGIPLDQEIGSEP